MKIPTKESEIIPPNPKIPLVKQTKNTHNLDFKKSYSDMQGKYELPLSI